MKTQLNKIVKGMSIKNNKGHYSEVTFASEKRNSVILADGSRYGYNYALELQK